MIRTALLTVVAGTVLAVPAAPSQAAQTQAAGCSGVSVVVDFASLGGGNQTRCAPADPDSGVAALRGAGFEPTRAAQQPGYFLCRIDGKPANDPCQRASPADAYWSYWHAQPGGSWSFSSSGPADYDPKPGAVEGWAFGAGDPPSAPPPAARRAEPSRTPAASPSPQSTRRPMTTSSPPGSRTSAAPVDRTPPAAAIGSSAPAPSPAPSAAAPSSSADIPAGPSPAASPSTAARAVPLAGDRAVRQDGSGPWVGVLIAAAVVALLGAGGAQQARRRR